MYQGTYARNPRKPRRRAVRMNKTAILLLAVILLAGAVIGTTVAYLTTNTGSIVNTFEYAKVTCEVQENFDGEKKSDVKIKNTCEIDAYIRAEVIVNWKDSEGNILPSTPEGYNYTITEHLDGKWKRGTDGYYYYQEPVKAHGATEGSLLTCTWTHPANPEYHLSVEIIASAIQSQPANVVTDAWKVTIPFGTTTTN